MANSKSDKSLVGILIIACTVIILIFHFAWSKYLFMNYSRPLFVIVDIALALAFAWASVKAYDNADDPNKDGLRWLAVIIAAVSCIWAAAWSTGLMNNIEQGI
jgi:multisubunit Na+/H+ antiporter MnhB subunit